MRSLREALAPFPKGAVAFGVVMLWLAVALSPAAAQDDEFVPDDEQVRDTEAIDFGSVDDLLATDEEVLSDPTLYTYDPGARRDPFRSLLKRRENKEQIEERPDGPAGLLIDELEVEGLFVLDGSPVAQVQSSSQQTSFLLRPGDQLWDGDVVRITLEEIVFKQSVNDPTALKPFREVVKRLNPSK
ncbi:MAG: hypothetical protein AAGN66_06100 [Acidobacteriota bacterium]